MDSGDLEGEVEIIPGFSVPIENKYKGLWATGLVRYSTTNPQVEVLGRLGLDLGDDDGLMLGAGVGYWIDKDMQLRGEYVIRDTVTSLQVNLVFRL